MMTQPLKNTAILVLLVMLSFVLWDSIIMYPLKLLIVFFHESSHAIMTIATGGKVKELVINMQQGGHVLSLGGNRFLTLSAGYLGSLLWGVLIYLFAAYSRHDKVFMAMLGLLMIGISLVFIRDIFTLIFSLIMAAAMLLCSLKATATLNDFILRLIGFTSMLYVPMDIYSDTIQRSHLRSDAYMLATEIGGTTFFWGALWLLISLFVIGISLWLSLRIKAEKTQVASE